MSITDGTSNTIFIGEKSVSSNSYNASTVNNWDDPAFQNMGGEIRAGSIIQRDAPSLAANGGPFSAPFSSGAPFGMYDGSVRFIPYDTTGYIVPLLTSNKGDIYTGP